MIVARANYLEVVGAVTCGADSTETREDQMPQSVTIDSWVIKS